MLYSRSCEYAIRALTFMAQKKEGEFLQVKDIAKQEGIPPYFLSKILQSLVRYKLLISARGPRGGFALARPAKEILLRDIVFAVDGENGYERCAVGLSECNDQAPCPLHEMWMHLKEQILEYFEITSLADLAEATACKLRLLEEGAMRVEPSHSSPKTD